MDISGAQLNSAVISAYNNAQLQVAMQQNRQAAPPVPQPRATATEVSLSRDGREQAARGDQATARDVQAAPARPAEASMSDTTRQSVVSRSAEGRSVPPREASPPPVQVQPQGASYTARVASQSYFSVSNM
ncbi:MAG: hypothetical protein N2Z69_09245 [Methylophilaceae bacterium]|nr:hypothetical protein [Methylophilaceae bacterium]